MNIHVQVFTRTYVFNSFKQIPRNTIVGRYGENMFSFVKKQLELSLNRAKRFRVLISDNVDPHNLVSTCIVSILDSLITAVIAYFLNLYFSVIHDVEHLFVCIFASV